MSSSNIRITLLFTLGMRFLAGSPAPGAPLAPCQILPAETWSSIMGYTAYATPGDMNCTYSSGNKTNGGQFRIIAIVGSKTEAETAVKRMRDHQEHQRQSKHDAKLSAVDSQGNVVFSIALFEPEVMDGTALQLQKLVAAVKQHLPK